MSSRRREDRSTSAAHADPYKVWVPTDKHPDYDSDQRRRHRSSTVPVHAHDPRTYPPAHDNRYQETRQSSRTHRQDPSYTSAAPATSYHQSSAPGPSSTSRTLHHATRPSAQYSSSGYQYQQSSSHQPSAPTQPSQGTNLYPGPVASSSRSRAYPEVPDPRLHSHRRPVATPTPKSSYEKVSSAEDGGRASRHPARAIHSSTQPPQPAPVNQSFWVPPAPEMSSSRRHKDRDKDRDREREWERERAEREKERERERTSAELERDRYKERMRAERHRERERATDAERYRDPSKSRHHDRRKESDTEGVMYSEQRNASKASLSGREGYAPSIREPSGGGHKRHWTEDGTAATSARRRQAETTQNPITTVPVHSTSEPQADGLTPQQTGEPPPAPRVMPVYLPPKAKSSRSHRVSVAQGAQSGSDTEWTSGKHRMERTQSGAAVQRSDGYVSSSTRDRGNQDVPMRPREDARSKLESKYGSTSHQDARQPLAQVNVDIPLVTPGFNASSLPSENRIGSAMPQFVSIRAGQGPSDPQAYDANFKSAAALRSDAPQEITIHPPHATSASIVKSSEHTRSHSSEVPRAQAAHPVVERSRTDPHGADPPPGHRMSIHESSRALPTPISRSQSYARGNPETGVENGSSSYPSNPHARPPSRSAHKPSVSNAAPPPAVAGPRPPRSAPQGQQTTDPPTRPPSVAHNYSGHAISSVPSQHSVPPSPAHRANSSPARTGHVHGSLPPSQPSPKDAQYLSSHHPGLPHTHSTPIQRAPSAPPTAHPTPLVVPQSLTSASQPSARHGAYPQAEHHGDQQPTQEIRFGPREITSQTSLGGTVKASWVVQTAPAAPTKGTPMSREDKYLRGHQQGMEAPYGTHAQLRQVLSSDQDPFPRATSSMMKASQAMTPPMSSQRNSPGAKAKDAHLGTSRGASVNSSPHSGQLKEAPTPEYTSRHDLPQPSPRAPGPPQIAVVGATPVSQSRDLPHNGRMDHGLLAPPFPAPTRVSRTTSNSREQRAQPTQPAPRNPPAVSYHPQPPPQGPPPSMFQPYPAPHPSSPEDNGQFSPPPLPIPAPRGFEDSPPPPIEMRVSETFPSRSQSNKDLAVTVPPIGHASTSSPLPAASSHTPASWQAGGQRSNVLPPTAQTGSLAVPQVDVRSARPSNMPVMQQSAQPDNDVTSASHQGMTRSWSGPQTQPSTATTRSRPKVTIEDVPEDSPMFGNTLFTSPLPITTPVSASRPTPASHQTSTGYTNSTAAAKSVSADQGAARSSPQSKVKDPPVHRSTEPSSAPLVAPPMPPPTPAPYVPASSRAPFSAPPTQPTFFPSTQPQPQRSASQTVPSRTYQRAAEMLQTSKPSTASTGAYPPVAAATAAQKSTATPVVSSQPTSSAAPPTNPWQHQANPPVNSASAQISSTTKPYTSTSTSAYAATAAPATHASKPASALMSGLQSMSNSIPPGGALGLHMAAPSSGTNTQMPSATETHRHQSSRAPPPTASSQEPASAPLMSSTFSGVKSQNYEQHNVDSTRTRGVTPTSTRNPPNSSHSYPASARPGTSTATSQQTYNVPPVQTPTHHRAVSLPTTQPSSAVQNPPSPRKLSQPIPSTNTQPFPSRPSPPEPQSTRVPVLGQLSAPVPRSSRAPPAPNHATPNDSEMLMTPSSIAPSPMLKPGPTGSVMQPMTVPIRTRQSSTDSKDSKKKPAGFFGLFRTKSGSSKPIDIPAAPTTTRPSLDHQRVHVDPPTAAAPAPTSAPTSAPQRVTSSSVPKEPKERTPASQPVVSTHTATQSRSRKVPDPISISPPSAQPQRERKDSMSNLFTPFKFLTMNSKRNRTMSGASLDVCDGNTATNTVIGSPDHSTVGQAPPLPPIIPPPVRDPLIATTEWRDREEAERRERKTNRIRRPGVTFDVEEEPPSPAPGTTHKRKKLVRRASGRAGTPAITPSQLKQG